MLAGYSSPAGAALDHGGLGVAPEGLQEDPYRCWGAGRGGHEGRRFRCLSRVEACGRSPGTEGPAPGSQGVLKSKDDFYKLGNDADISGG